MIITKVYLFIYICFIFLCCRDNAIPWQNVVSFMSDNCSVMKGSRNSVITRIREKNPHIFDMGCVCHLANLCTVAAVKTLPLPVEDLLVDVYFHFYHRYINDSVICLYILMAYPRSKLVDLFTGVSISYTD